MKESRQHFINRNQLTFVNLLSKGDVLSLAQKMADKYNPFIYDLSQEDISITFINQPGDCEIILRIEPKPNLNRSDFIKSVSENYLVLKLYDKNIKVVTHGKNWTTFCSYDELYNNLKQMFFDFLYRTVVKRQKNGHLSKDTFFQLAYSYPIHQSY